MFGENTFFNTSSKKSLNILHDVSCCSLHDDVEKPAPQEHQQNESPASNIWHVIVRSQITTHITQK